MKIEHDGLYTRKTLEVGDKIRCKGVTAEIAKIYCQDYWENEGFSCEFEDTKGNYRNWKQAIDGGAIVE